MSRPAGRTNPPVGYPRLKLMLANIFNCRNIRLLMTLQESQHVIGGSSIICDSIIALLDA